MPRMRRKDLEAGQKSRLLQAANEVLAYVASLFGRIKVRCTKELWQTEEERQVVESAGSEILSESWTVDRSIQAIISP